MHAANGARDFAFDGIGLCGEPAERIGAAIEHQKPPVDSKIVLIGGLIEKHPAVGAGDVSDAPPGKYWGQSIRVAKPVEEGGGNEREGIGAQTVLIPNFHEGIEMRFHLITGPHVAGLIMPFRARGHPIAPEFVSHSVQGQLDVPGVFRQKRGGFIQPGIGFEGIVPPGSHPCGGRQAPEEVGAVPFGKDHCGLGPHMKAAPEINDGLIIGGNMVPAEACPEGSPSFVVVGAAPPTNIIDDDLQGDGYGCFDHHLLKSTGWV
ncbi:MAG: hypothetical protein ACK49J_09835 [Verrucomicrobiota bacterium]